MIDALLAANFIEFFPYDGDKVPAGTVASDGTLTTLYGPETVQAFDSECLRFFCPADTFDLCEGRRVPHIDANGEYIEDAYAPVI